MRDYRLGLDLGTNSLGWCAVELDAEGKPCGVLDAGVRILTPNEEAGRDPQSKASLAAGRRDARSARRRRDRFQRRQKRLMERLIEAGLMPADEGARKALEQRDPYRLRADALHERLDPHEIGRAIFHLNQRRGFKSNRMADGDDKEAGAMKQGMAKLKAALNEEGADTLGQFLANRHARDRDGFRIDKMGRRIGRTNGGAHSPNAQGVRFRPHAEGAKLLYDFYPTRDMVEHELEKIWKKQAEFYPDQLTDGLLARLKRIVEQRPLKKPLVGRCTLRPEIDIVAPYGFEIDNGERAPKAHPLFQRFRILQDVSQLRVAKPGEVERHLTLQERDTIVAKLMQSGGSIVDFEKLRISAKLPDEMRFNYELSGRSGFQPDQTAVKLSPGKLFGKDWRSFKRELQIEIVERLLAVADACDLQDWLRDKTGIGKEAAERMSEVRLPQGHGQFGRATLAMLVDVMENDSREEQDRNTGEFYRRPLTYDEAVKRLDFHHSKLEVGQHARLPYYGEAMARHVISNPAAPEGSQERIGRVPNPTVHIALNQMRAVVNALVDAYGPPREIVLELARELKQNRKQKDEAIRKNRENEKANQERRGILARLGHADTHGNRLLLRLHEELPAADRVCVYCGEKNIGSIAELFSGQFDIDHILPRSKTLDDGFANKALCCRACNSRKGNRPPADVWKGEELRLIAERAERLFRYKAWRFAPDAMEKYAEHSDFIARHLTDSQHMARLAKDYLGHLYGDDRNRRVWAVPGRLTSMLRGMWGLGALLRDHNRLGGDEEASVKNRDDHRHHALDAFVVACTDRRILQRIATASGRAEALDLDRWAAKGEFPEPFAGYREQLGAKLDAMVISHKPDHGVRPGGRNANGATSGKLHEETAYGMVEEEIDGKRFNLVTRKPIHALSEKEIGQVRDARLREELQEVAYEAKRHDEKLADALARFAEERGIRRVRLLKTERFIVPVNHGGGKFEKAYVPGSNQRLEIFQTPDGKWRGEGISVFDANRRGFLPSWRRDHPDARLVMRLHKGDLFEADFGAGPELFVARKLSPANSRIEFVSHRRAGKIEGSDYMQAAYSKLQAAGARRMRVDPIGRVTPAEDRA